MIAVIILLSGCCNWEVEDDMGKPRGISLLGNEATILLSTPTVVTACECGGNIPRSLWYNCINIPIFTWDPISGWFSYAHPVDFTQYASKTLQLWWTLDGESTSGWTRFNDDEWTIIFTEAFTTFGAKVDDKIPINGDFFMILMDGPSGLQCLWPSVPNPMPM